MYVPIYLLPEPEVGQTLRMYETRKINVKKISNELIQKSFQHNLLYLSIFFKQTKDYEPHLFYFIRSESFCRFVLKNHLTAIYSYIRTENSSTGCTNILRGFCKMLWYCSILFYFESVRSVVNQWKNNYIFTGLNVFFNALNFRFWQVSQSFDLIGSYDYGKYLTIKYLDKNAKYRSIILGMWIEDQTKIMRSGYYGY